MEEVPVVSPTECVFNVPVPQVGDVLVKVPNVVSQAVFQQRSVEHTVDIPVHGDVIWARGGLQGSFSGQVSTASRRADLAVFPSFLVL